MISEEIVIYVTSVLQAAAARTCSKVALPIRAEPKRLGLHLKN